MTDNRTAELREKLAERGVDYEVKDLSNIKFFHDTRWNANGVHWCYTEFVGATTCLTMCNEWKDCTPEQAIAATLGDEWDNKPFVEYAEHVAKEVYGEAFALLEGCDEPDFSAIDAICAACEDVMRITDRWKRGESQDEFTAPESAELGSGLNPDGLPVGLTISDDGNLLNWRGENYVKQSTLSNGTLTAEQVRKAIRKYAQDDSCYIFEVYGEMCGPIAEELNATLGSEHAERTCKVVSSYYYDDYDQYEFEFSCGHSVNMYDKEPPNYCPNCGRRVER